MDADDRRLAMAGGSKETGSEAGVEALVRAYYHAIVSGEPLARFYATDEEAGDLGPAVKVGSGRGEVFIGYAAIAAEVERVTMTFTRNRLASRALIARRRDGLGWFADQVWWSGDDSGMPFGSLTRWTGVCLRCPTGWKLLQLHVSEEV